MSEKEYTCPLCEATVDFFKVYVLEESIYKVWHHGDGSLEWRHLGWNPESQQHYDIRCPECGERVKKVNTEIEVSEVVMVQIKVDPEDVESE